MELVFSVGKRYSQYSIFNTHGVNKTAQGFSVGDTMTDDSYLNTSEIKLSTALLFSVHIM